MSHKDLSKIPDLFFSSETEEEKRNRKKSIILTAAVFLGLFLLFLFTALRSPDIRPGPMGIEVRVGHVNEGFRGQDHGAPEVTDPADNIEDQLEDASDQQETDHTETDQTPDEQHAYNLENAHPLDAQDPNTEESPEEDQQEQTPEIDPNALYPGSTDEHAGDDDVLADAGEDSGDEDADAQADAGQARFDAGGFSYDLGARKMSKAPNVKDETQKRGIVVVEIRVNRNGEVVHARPGIRGSTTTDPELLEIAAASAMDTEFEPDPDAPEEQRGSMVFRFRLE